MAINSKNFVDISTTFPSADVSGRSFGGLVFTASDTVVATRDGKPIPKDEKGNPYTPAGDKYVYAEIEGQTYYWEWVEKDAMWEVVVDGVTLYPDNAQEIAIYESYSNGEPIGLNLGQTKLVFGVESDEYKFADGYYTYISPSGRFASKLQFAKLAQGTSPKAAFAAINEKTNMFGSFTFLTPSYDGSSDGSETDWIQELYECALYNSNLDTKYLFVVNADMKSKVATSDNTLTVKADAAVFTGNGRLKGTYFLCGYNGISAYMPMAVLASTDYATGQVVNFMFKQFDTEVPTVESDAIYTDFNQALINFYGLTQSNGQTLAFLQRGFNTDGQDTAIYCNEMWFKSACETALLDLLVSRERLPASTLGVDLVKLEVIDVCSIATRNGTFMQKAAAASDLRTVREIVVASGGDDTDVGSIEADVASKGYSVYAYLSEVQDTQKLGPTKEKIIVYYVFYGTADSVRFIKGNDILLK